jgi:hypothetical protein
MNNDIDLSIPPERIVAALEKIQCTATPAMKAFLIYHIRARGGSVPPTCEQELHQSRTAHA